MPKARECSCQPVGVWFCRFEALFEPILSESVGNEWLLLRSRPISVASQAFAEAQSHLAVRSGIPNCSCFA